jgi:hypothetical protein
LAFAERSARSTASSFSRWITTISESISLLGRHLSCFGLRFSLSNARVADYFGIPLPPNGLQVPLVIRDALDLKEVEYDSELAQVFAGPCGNLAGDFQALGVGFLGTDRSHDAAQRAFENLLRRLIDGLGSLAQETFDCTLEPVLGSTRQLDVGAAFNVDRNHPGTQNLREVDVHRPGRQR